MANDSYKSLIERLSRSQIYLEYEQAFSQTTGLPLALRPVEVWRLVHQGKKNQNPFCALIGQHSRSCAACLQVQRKIAESSTDGPHTFVCLRVCVRRRSRSGWATNSWAISKPARSFLASPPTAISTAWRNNSSIGDSKSTWRDLRTPIFTARCFPRAQFDAVIRLLTIFAQHLSIVSNQVVVQEENAEPPVIVKAKQYIHEHQTNDLSLSEVAKAVNTSTFYFCKMFKKATGP